MKVLVAYLIILLPLCALAQDRKWTISYENNVNKLELDHLYAADDIKGYDNLPSYFNSFEADIATRHRRYDGDTLSSLTKQASYRPFHTVYFRNTHIGIGTELYTSQHLDISHTAGLNLSLADYDIGTIRSYTENEYVRFDSTEYVEIRYREMQAITAHKKIRRLALSYENALTLKPMKWFNVSLGTRHQVHFKFTDHLYSSYFASNDTIAEYNYYLCGLDYGPLYWGIRQINLYDKQHPSNLADKSKRNLSLQYDLALFVRPEFVMGKEKRSSLYFNIGFTPVQFYGQDFVPRENPMWYGFGLSRSL